MQNAHDGNSVPFLAIKEQMPFIGEDDQALVKVLTCLSKIRSLGKSFGQVFQPVDIFNGLSLAPGFQRVVDDGLKVALCLFGNL